MLQNVRPAAIFIGFVVVSACVLAGFALSAGGLLAWRLNAGAPAVPSQPPPTPVLATPVQPALVTPTRLPQLTATLAITASVTLTATLPTGVFALTPSLPAELLDQTPLAPVETGPASEEATPGAAAQPAAPTPARIFPPVAPDINCIPINRPSARAQVLSVQDGATIVVNDGGITYTVAYIGVGLFDFTQDPAVWQQMTDANRRLVEGKNVLLIQDHTDVDPVGRRPRYVFVGNTFVNLEMIASGHALAQPLPPDLNCQRLFAEAQQRAADQLLGMLAPTATATRILIMPPTATVAVTGPMQITALAQRGTLWQEPEEWVEFRNDSQEPIQLRGWTLQDDQRHIFTFPAFTLGPGQYCRVYTNEYHPTSCGFSYLSQSPIWDNENECAYLKDPYGKLISQYCYGYP